MKWDDVFFFCLLPSRFSRPSRHGTNRYMRFRVKGNVYLCQPTNDQPQLGKARSTSMPPFRWPHRYGSFSLLFGHLRNTKVVRRYRSWPVMNYYQAVLYLIVPGCRTLESCLVYIAPQAPSYLRQLGMKFGRCPPGGPTQPAASDIPSTP